VTWEEHRAGQALAMAHRSANQHEHGSCTHRRVINTLESLKYYTVASWYWQHMGINEEADLDKPAPKAI